LRWYVICNYSAIQLKLYGGVVTYNIPSQLQTSVMVVVTLLASPTSSHHCSLPLDMDWWWGGFQSGTSAWYWSGSMRGGWWMKVRVAAVAEAAMTGVKVVSDNSSSFNSDSFMMYEPYGDDDNDEWMLVISFYSIRTKIDLIKGASTIDANADEEDLC